MVSPPGHAKTLRRRIFQNRLSESFSLWLGNIGSGIVYFENMRSGAFFWLRFSSF
jgi:hypothetical protein